MTRTTVAPTRGVSATATASLVNAASTTQSSLPGKNGLDITKSLRASGAAYAKLARAHGYVDGYMRVLLETGVAEHKELLALVSDEGGLVLRLRLKPTITSPISMQISAAPR